MDKYIAIAAKGRDGTIRHFLTIGRLWGSANERPYHEIIHKFGKACAGHGDIVEIEICYSLQDASKSPYFYESLLGLLALSATDDEIRD